MRRFKLINAEGAEWDLNDVASFFQHPDGLGFERKMQSVPAGYDFIEIDDEPVQKKPMGEMVFKTYERYSEFAEFIAKTPLVLCYAPIDKWHYLDCKVQRLGKGEKDRETRRIICPIDFLGFSTWYDSLKMYSVQASTATGKTYPYTYPYTYIDTAMGTVMINNESKIEKAPCKLHIFGPVTNPSWALIRDDVTVLNGKVNAIIASGNKLVVDSSPKTFEIAEYTTSNVFVRNLYQDSDFDTQRFIRAPIGESLMSFTHEGVETMSPPIVEVKQLADTV